MTSYIDINVTDGNSYEANFDTLRTVYFPWESELGTANYMVNSGRVRVDFVEGCLPEWPVYIRWVNHLGGFEFHMFKGRKTYTEEADRGDTYVLADAADLDATATRGQLPGEVSRTLACGAGGLDFDMWKFLKGVALSPAVWVYDTSRGEFVQVTLKGTSIEWDSGNATGSVDFELQLIDENYMI